ncbi:expressed unknown protein [Seminavis robusta]|uniref:Uncharacterized protein n=1 Tax=Seminavis robusta TaxID=568900 RepID=A0A9N8D4A7_9STRA|nr:expressed unknown protein [Seminavis robusta]|eukprot:Sro2_g001190.1 n/a (604) ;mRNA; f:53646-55565
MGIYRSHISVNLNQANVCQALLALNEIPKAQQKVKTAHVHATCPSFPPHVPATTSSTGTNTSSTKGKNARKNKACMSKAHRMESIIQVFRAIASLPNLTSLTVDLEYFAALPVGALLELLIGKCQLESLQLSHLQLVATTTDTNPDNGNGNASMEDTHPENELDLLRLILNNQPRLSAIHFTSCRGNPAIMQALILEPPALQSIHLDGTPIAPVHTPQNPSSNNETITASTCSCTDTLARILRASPQLKELSLMNLPLGQISDKHIQTMAGELSWGEACKQLTDLTIVSSLLGEETGEAISNMLVFNDSIRALTLHIDWEEIGYAVSKMIQTNSTLQRLDVRVYGDEDFITDGVVAVAQALEKPFSSLQKLRLCFEFEPSRIPGAVLDAFSKALETNETLGKLVLTDTIEKCALPVAMRTRLRLNRLGVHDLLRAANETTTITTGATDTAASKTESSRNASPSVHETFVEAIISAKNDIHVVYNLLSNYPLLCMAPLEQEQTSTSTSTSDAKLSSSHLALESISNYNLPIKIPYYTKTFSRLGGGGGYPSTGTGTKDLAFFQVALPSTSTSTSTSTSSGTSSSTKRTAKKLGRTFKSLFAPSA